jgi:hypothetical protein
MGQVAEQWSVALTRHQRERLGLRSCEGEWPLVVTKRELGRVMACQECSPAGCAMLHQLEMQGCTAWTRLQASSAGDGGLLNLRLRPRKGGVRAPPKRMTGSFNFMLPCKPPLLPP